MQTKKFGFTFIKFLYVSNVTPQNLSAALTKIHCWEGWFRVGPFQSITTFTLDS